MSFPGWLTPASLVALALGFSLGALGNATDSGLVAAVADVLNPVGAIWMTALRFSVVPLVLLQVMAPILHANAERGLGALVGKALGLFLLLFVAGGVASAVLSPALVGLYTPDPGTADAIRRSVDPDLVARMTGRGGGGEAGPTTLGLLLAILSGRWVLPLLFAAMAVAVVARHTPEGTRRWITRRVEAALALVLRVVMWILLGTPAGVFAIVLSMSLSAGLGAVEVALVLVLMWSGILLVFTALLYPLTWLLGGMSMRAFARGVAPAQLVAVSTRSSVASLPALVEGAEQVLGLPERVRGLVLPLAVSVFKFTEPIQATFRLAFLASVFGVSLGVLDLAAFLTFLTVTSVSVIGMPGGGGMVNLPAYLAAGLPIEGILLTEALEQIPDIFMTLGNVTADMSVAVILSTSRASGVVDDLERRCRGKVEVSPP